jgi:beta-N-acetylhexosaminidase
MSIAHGPIVFDIAGTELTAEDRELLQHPLIGGIIFFARNYKSPQQITDLCSAVRQARSTPVLILVDQEGGRVQRFKEGFTRLPSMGEIGKVYESNPRNGLALARTAGWVMAAEVLSVGVDLSFAPVLDRDLGNNPAIGNRAFHQDIAIIVELATAFTEGMRGAGMAAVGKHFPGHGCVAVDSHVDLPVDTRTFEEIAAVDLPPFAAMIDKGIAGMMAAHILFSSTDKTAVGFSRFWLQDVLRRQLQFRGMIFSDDLSMAGAAIAGGFPQRVIGALEAGCDMALVCNSRESVLQTLHNFPEDKYVVADKLFESMRGDFNKIPGGLSQSAIWQEQHARMMELLAVNAG